MDFLADLRALVDAFGREAAVTDPDASVRSTIWPTAGAVVDHLGTIHRWAAEQVRTGARADRREFRRPEGVVRVAWFREGARELVRVLGGTDPERPVPVLYGADGTAGFWRRRMAHEAAKHLWDLRTAVDPDPRFPPEAGVAGRADAVDEFGEVFMAEARRRGIAPLPGPVVLVAADSGDAWVVSPEWVMRRVRDDGRHDGAHAHPGSAATITGEVGDLALLLWERADLAARDRFRIDGDAAAATAFATTPVHL